MHESHNTARHNNRDFASRSKLRGINPKRTMKHLSSRRSPLLLKCRDLHGSKGRREHGAFLIEGENSVAAALAARFALQEVLVSAAHEEKWRVRLEERGIDYSVAAPELVAHAAEARTSPEILGVAPLPVEEPEAEIGGLTLILDGVSDPGNVGTLLRAADAVGSSRVWATPGSADFYSPKVVRASAGSLFSFKYLPRVLAAEEALQVLARSDVPVVAAQAHGGSGCYEFGWPARCALVVGHETRGVGQVLGAGAQAVTIPIWGRAESLNAAMAGTLLLYAWRQSL
jgi:TrmH family RNA methyltransferase